ncbi:MAG: hypothetical protein ACM3XN_05570 [Chloroflexota bacterium]
MNNPWFYNTVGAISTLMIFSYLWKENAVYRIAEHIFVGLSGGYIVTYNWHSTLKPAIQQEIQVDKQYYLITAIIIGLLMYFRYFPKVAWLARIPMSIWVGYGVGYTLVYAPAPFITQITNSFQKFSATYSTWYGTNTVNNILFFVFLISTMMYFFFTVKRDNPVMAGGAMLGRIVLMLAFGSAFGNTVQGRISLFIGRVNFLLGTWLGLIK